MHNMQKYINTSPPNKVNSYSAIFDDEIDSLVLVGA